VLASVAAAIDPHALARCPGKRFESLLRDRRSGPFNRVLGPLCVKADLIARGLQFTDAVLQHGGGQIGDAILDRVVHSCPCAAVGRLHFANESGYRVYGSVRTITPQSEMSGVTLVELDVKDDNSVRSAVQSILQKEQRIDALVNNAGLALTGSIEETTIEDASGEPGGSLTLAPSPD
jgi:hypothetical protein